MTKTEMIRIELIEAVDQIFELAEDELQERLRTKLGDESTTDSFDSMRKRLIKWEIRRICS